MSIVLLPTAVAPGLHMLSVRTPTLPPATHTNAYLCGDNELVLVEPASGYPEEVELVCAWVEARVAAGARLRAVVLTHHHHDHVAGAAAVCARLNAPLWAHSETARRLPRDLRVAHELADGEQIALDGARVLTVVHTPGHAPGHICLLDSASGALIAGDMIAGVGSILVEASDGDMTLYLASLARMDTLAASQLLPAHGLPIPNAREKLQGYIAHRLAREAKILAALRTLVEASPVEQLVPLAYADTPPMAWPLARLASEAHLIKLVRDGLAVREGARYRAV